MSFFGMGNEQMAAPSISLVEAIGAIEQRKQTLPYDAETIVRVDELDHVLELLRRVRIDG